MKRSKGHQHPNLTMSEHKSWLPVGRVHNHLQLDLLCKQKSNMTASRQEETAWSKKGPSLATKTTSTTLRGFNSSNFYEDPVPCQHRSSNYGRSFVWRPFPRELGRDWLHGSFLASIIMILSSMAYNDQPPQYTSKANAFHVYFKIALCRQEYRGHIRMVTIPGLHQLLGGDANGLG